MRHVLSRQQLYDMIWERAVSKVAPELGISDVALRKHCVKHAIPLPDATYWGRRHAGRPVERKRLGPAPEGIGDRIVIDARPLPPAPAPVEAAIAVAKQPVGSVVVPDKLHSLVTKTLSLARMAQSDRNGAITGLGPEAFKIRAHLDTLERVGSFLNRLVYGALARGYRFTQGREGLEIMVDDEAISFTVSQTIRRSLHVATEEETRRLERWDARHRNDWDSWRGRPSIPYYDFKPTGDMAIEIAGWARFAGAQHRFADTRTRKIESRIDEMLVSFVAVAAGKKLERAEAQQRARLEEIARQKRAEQARLAKLEKDREDFLDRKLAQVQERDQLATFMASLTAEPANSSDAAYQVFLDWTQQRLDRMNARLLPQAIARELAGIEAFLPPVGQSDGES